MTAAEEPIAPSTVLVCDDQPDLRDALRAVLATLPRFRLVAEAESGSSCLAELERSAPDVLILDVSFPRGGADLARRARPR